MPSNIALTADVNNCSVADVSRRARIGTIRLLFDNPDPREAGCRTVIEQLCAQENSWRLVLRGRCLVGGWDAAEFLPRAMLGLIHNLHPVTERTLDNADVPDETL